MILPCQFMILSGQMESYFTNLNFPEIRGTHLESLRHSPRPSVNPYFLNHHFGVNRSCEVASSVSKATRFASDNFALLLEESGSDDGGFQPPASFLARPWKNGSKLVVFHQPPCRVWTCIAGVRVLKIATFWGVRILRVVGGWTNPFEKYTRQIGFIVSPIVPGWKSSEIFEVLPP